MSIVNEVGLFRELLQVATGHLTQLPVIPSAAQWESLLDESERQAVAGSMMEGLERLPQNQLPPLEIKLQWIGLLQINEQTYSSHKAFARELTESFRSRGFHSCILKGLSSAERYPNPNRRQCGDIDIWVKGSRKDIKAFVSSEYNLIHEDWHHLNYCISEDVEVEVHIHPSWLYNPLHNSRLLKWFREQESIQFNQSPNPDGFVKTTASFDAVFMLAHASHHLLEEGLGVRHVVDYYYVLIQLSEQERKDAIKTIEWLGMGRLSSAMMYVLNIMCGFDDEMMLCPPNEKEGRFLLEEILSAGNFGKERKGEELRRNSLKRFLYFVKHYPSEVLWMFPWKIWHWGWRIAHRY